MEGIGLKVQVRAFPSHGRARVNESVLEMLDVAQGDQIDLYSTPDAKPITVTIYADSMVEVGAIRLDKDEVNKLGVQEGAVITVVKTPTFAEKIRGATSRTTKSVEEGVGSVSRRITGKSEETEEQKKEQ
jgi:hypothetical protein